MVKSATFSTIYKPCPLCFLHSDFVKEIDVVAEVTPNGNISVSLTQTHWGKIGYSAREVD